MIKELEARVGVIRDKAIVFHTTIGGDVQELRYLLLSLASRVAVLRGRKPNQYDLASEQMQLRQAVTAGAFETGRKTPIATTDPLIQRLWLASDQFVVAAYAAHDLANRAPFA